MQLEVTFRNLEPRHEIRARGAALYAKLERFLDIAAEGQLIVGIERNEATCEVVVTTRGRTFKALERNADMQTAMDKAFHAVEEQLRRFKDRRTSHKARSPERLTGFVMPENSGAVEIEA